MTETIGDILQQMGIVTRADIETAIREHRRCQIALGAALVQLGRATPEQVNAALDCQRALRSGDRVRAALAKADIAKTAGHATTQQARAVRSHVADVKRKTGDYEAVVSVDRDDATPRER